MQKEDSSCHNSCNFRGVIDLTWIQIRQEQKYIKETHLMATIRSGEREQSIHLI